MMGWMKPYLGILATLIVAWIFLRMCKEPFEEKIEWNLKNSLSYLVCLAIIAILVILSGIGGLTYQNEDHLYRNIIFETLVNKTWPVYFTSNNGSTNLGLCYYIGFWLPSAIIGKLMGLNAGYLFQIAYAMVGVSLVAYFIFYSFNEVSISKLLGFFFFSGLDIIGYLIVHNGTYINFITHLEWWAEIYEYSSFTTQLFWVFNQSIIAWVVVLLIFLQNDNHYIIFIMSALLISGTLPAVGLAPYVLYLIYRNSISLNKRKLSYLIRDIFSTANVLGGGIISTISIAFLSSNRAVTSNYSHFLIHSGRDLILYLTFAIIEFGVYLLLIFDAQYNNALFWITAAILIVCPLVRVGEGHDFCMRASIPALMLLYIMVLDTLQKYRTEKKYLRYCAILIVFLIGAITPAMECNRTIYTEFTYNEFTSYDKYKNKSNGNGQGLYMIDKRECTSIEELLSGLNFSCNVNDNLFYKYLAK